MATALIPVFTGTIADRTAQLCDARTLHTFMQVKRDFSNWIKGRISKFGFVENEDYLLAKSGEQVLAKSGENLGGRPSIDYHLTLDMAKELAMVENNEQGRAARKYFIACERELRGQLRPHNPALDYTRISPAQAQDLKELVQSIVDAGIQNYGETWARLHRKFRVNSYLELPASRFEEACQYLMSKMPEAPAPQPTVLIQALAAARESAHAYMGAFAQAVQSGQPGPRMEDIPQHLLEGIVSEALMRSRFLAGFDMQTGKMHVQLVPQDASVFSFQTGDYSQAVSAIPTKRLPELQDAISRRVARHLVALHH